ncbi:hypothetical protein ACSSS7_001218 [Eimeria intestinalis]
MSSVRGSGTQTCLLMARQSQHTRQAPDALRTITIGALQQAVLGSVMPLASMWATASRTTWCMAGSGALPSLKRPHDSQWSWRSCVSSSGRRQLLGESRRGTKPPSACSYAGGSCGGCGLAGAAAMRRAWTWAGGVSAALLPRRRGHQRGDAETGRLPVGGGRADPSGGVRREQDALSHGAIGNQTRVVTDEGIELVAVALEDEGMLGETDTNLVLVQEIDASHSRERDVGHNKERRRGFEWTKAHSKGDTAQDAEAITGDAQNGAVLGGPRGYPSRACAKARGAGVVTRGRLGCPAGGGGGTGGTSEDKLLDRGGRGLNMAALARAIGKKNSDLATGGANGVAGAGAAGTGVEEAAHGRLLELADSWRPRCLWGGGKYFARCLRAWRASRRRPWGVTLMRGRLIARSGGWGRRQRRGVKTVIYCEGVGVLLPPLPFSPAPVIRMWSSEIRAVVADPSSAEAWGERKREWSARSAAGRQETSARAGARREAGRVTRSGGC